MYKTFNILILLAIIFFIISTYKYYISNKNIDNKNYNRSNIEKIIKEKISSLPVLTNDTNNVIFFNDSFENEININKKRSFWDLLNKK